MFYRPEQVWRMWDTWCYYHNGTHYMYYLSKKEETCPRGGIWDCIGLATSEDGVHWHEQGVIFEKNPDVTRLGTGAVNRSIGGNFIMNYSEIKDGGQYVKFLCSADLMHWERMEDKYDNHITSKWYVGPNNNGDYWGWAHFLPLSREEGGYWGYNNARTRSKPDFPDGLPYKSVGMVQSADGLQWDVLKPPVFEWGIQPQEHFEVGGVEKIGDKYYMICGATGYKDDKLGMYVFIGDSPKGPFRPDDAMFRLYGAKKPNFNGYYLQFYRTPEELLVIHHSIPRMEEGEQDYFESKNHAAILKRAFTDNDGHLRLGYWHGNDRAKGKKLKLNTDHLSDGWEISDSRILCTAGNEIRIMVFGSVYNLTNGVLMEGKIKLLPASQSRGLAGVFIENGETHGTVIMFGTDGTVTIGELDHMGQFVCRTGGHGFEVTDYIGGFGYAAAKLVPGTIHSFRLLIRHTMLELYLDDLFVQAYSLPTGSQTGRVGFICSCGTFEAENVNIWEMNV